jgi:hypothetical protein
MSIANPPEASIFPTLLFSRDKQYRLFQVMGLMMQRRSLLLMKFQSALGLLMGWDLDQIEVLELGIRWDLHHSKVLKHKFSD